MMTPWIIAPCPGGRPRQRPGPPPMPVQRSATPCWRRSAATARPRRWLSVGRSGAAPSPGNPGTASAGMFQRRASQADSSTASRAAGSSVSILLAKRMVGSRPSGGTIVICQPLAAAAARCSKRTIGVGSGVGKGRGGGGRRGDGRGRSSRRRARHRRQAPPAARSTRSPPLRQQRRSRPAPVPRAGHLPNLRMDRAAPGRAGGGRGGRADVPGRPRSACCPWRCRAVRSPPSGSTAACGHNRRQAGSRGHSYRSCSKRSERIWVVVTVSPAILAE